MSLSTRLKVSVSQDGMLPQETVEVATLEFPMLTQKLLKALSFERIDPKIYVGILPVSISLGGKEQEIEIEMTVSLPEMRKKIIEVFKTPVKVIAAAEGKQTSRASRASKKAAPDEAKDQTKSPPSTKKAVSKRKATTRTKKAPTEPENQ